MENTVSLSQRLATAGRFYFAVLFVPVLQPGCLEKKSADEGEGITQLSIGADEASNTADEPKADARRDGLRQIAELLGSRKKENEDAAALAADAKDDGAADAAGAADESAAELKEDKLRQIETLLRRNDI